MSATVPATDLLTAAKTAAKKNYTANAASSASASSSSTSSNALSSLTNNYNQFLSLLTTQLQNQDPTSPMQSDTFTSELAQFAGVEQQIKTNTNLTQLISLSQDNAINQSTSLVGRQAVVSSSQMALQNGTAELRISPASAETAEVAITNSAGKVVRTQSLDLSAGANTWTWDGKDDSGTTLADGTYTAAVVAEDSGGTGTSSVPFSVIGTITGLTKNSSGGVQIQMGSTTADMSAVTSLIGTSSSGASVSGRS